MKFLLAAYILASSAIYAEDNFVLTESKYQNKSKEKKEWIKFQDNNSKLKGILTPNGVTGNPTQPTPSQPTIQPTPPKTTTGSQPVTTNTVKPTNVPTTNITGTTQPGVTQTALTDLETRYSGRIKRVGMDLLGSGRSYFYNSSGDLVVDLSPQLRREAIANFDGTLSAYATGEYFFYVDGALVRHEDLSKANPTRFQPNKPVWFSVGHWGNQKINTTHSVLTIAFVYKDIATGNSHIVVSERTVRK